MVWREYKQLLLRLIYRGEAQLLVNPQNNQYNHLEDPNFDRLTVSGYITSHGEIKYTK